MLIKKSRHCLSIDYESTKTQKLSESIWTDISIMKIIAILLYAS